MTESSFIKAFVELDQKIEKLRDENALRHMQTEAKIADTEQRLLEELRDLRTTICNSNHSINEELVECKTSIVKHDGHFNLIKVFATTGVASLVAFYSWMSSFIHK